MSSSAAALEGVGLAAVMAPPPLAIAGAAPAPLDSILERTTQREHCADGRIVVGISGAWAVVIRVPCGSWSCAVCGPSKVNHFTRIAREGCELSAERVRLLTITCPAESPAISWAELGARWNRMNQALKRQLGRRLSYFGTVEVQRRGNPHLHLLLRDSGYIPKADVHAAGFRAGFGFSDIRQIRPGPAVGYITKYITKASAQRFPKGVRRVRRSRDWAPRPVAGKWGEGWKWRLCERTNAARVAGELVGAGYLLAEYEQRPAADDTGEGAR